MSGPGTIVRFAAFAADAAAAGLDAKRRERAARAVLDTVGLAALGATRPVRSVVDDAVGSWGAADSASVVGVPARVPATTAAFAHGVLAHCTDFDDTHLPSVLHPSSCVVPAALATAEALDRHGPEFLDAVELGTELTIRLGIAGRRADGDGSIFFDRGLHATSICGAVGAAVAASLLRSGDAATIAAAAGIAASMGAGVLESNRTGGTVKQVHAGWAAHCGVAAAQMAASGLTAAPTVLEGRFGFLRAFCGAEADPDAVERGLGRTWHTDELVVKPYPCNHFTHCAIDAALILRDRGLRAGDVRELRLGLPEAVLRTLAEPAAEKATPATGYAGAFSGPYTVAAALAGGGGLGLGIDDFTDEAVARPEVLALAGVVTCVADAECTAIFPTQFPARLTAIRHDGSRVGVLRTVNRGGPHLPMTDEEMTGKFAHNAGRLFGPAAVSGIPHQVGALSTGAALRPLGDLLRATP